MRLGANAMAMLAGLMAWGGTPPSLERYASRVAPRPRPGDADERDLAAAEERRERRRAKRLAVRP